MLLTGGTGVHSVNNQIQADKYAAEGFLVVMPDQYVFPICFSSLKLLLEKDTKLMVRNIDRFSGDPAPNSSTQKTIAAEENPSVIEQVKLGIASAAKSFTIDMWLARHTPEKVLPILDKVITAIQEEFADAVAHGGGIYAIGYCFGAKYVLLLGSADEISAATGQMETEGESQAETLKHEPKIKAGAIAHGTHVTVANMENCRVPVCVVAVEDDSLFPDEVRDAGVKKMLDRGNEHELKVYPGVPHGFAVFGDYEDATIKEKQKEAFEQMLQWLKSH